MPKFIIPKTSRQIIGRILLHLDEIDSTNTFLLKNEALLSEDGLTVYADRQTGGRGRMERSWSGGAADKRHLFCSVVVHIRGFLCYIYPSITILIGLATFRALRLLGVKGHMIKWPNDILIAGRKLCGILCEVRSVGDMKVMVAGIGINLEGGPEQFGPSLRDKATTLEASVGIKVKRDHMLNVLLDEIDKILIEARDGLESIFREWETSSGMIGKAVLFEYQEEEMSGIVTGLDSSGHLIIDTDMGSITLASGGISLRCPI
ncbi:MAG: biotin--[acetyl-CoA-carboxylase] ligase [Dissulfurimicrobium sp.]|uniref:biotin--[acetyl-CoA-carboxylase] ligase n=1 Tax=Dissulfurimicrobium TaxID=1769732 RepID=UPI003C74663B